MKQHELIWMVAFAVLLTSVLCLLTSADTPAWWSNVIDTNAVPNDYAPATAGQLKWMATKAYDELQTNLPGGAGTGVASLVSGFSTSNNYAPVNLGQLKYVAEPFYQRLIAKEYTNAFPWTTNTIGDDADFAPANLGQLKNVFSFELTRDTDDDDLPDWWENHWFGGTTNWGGADDLDGDQLANSNEYTWLTCPTNSDTDGDGASDGDEIAHSTNPLNNPGDTDQDGLSDDLEEVLETDRDLPDTDGDWVSDGYEYEQNTDPLYAGSTPPLRLEVDGGEFYAKSTTLEIRIRGLVADELILAEALTMENAVTNPSSEVVYFSLNGEENGTRSVYVAAVRGGVTGFMATATIILDTIPPYLSVTNPSGGLITADRWVTIEGVATDGVSSVCVKLNGGWADGVSAGQFWKTHFMLSPGTNLIGITGADDAGHCVTQSLAIVQDLSLDTNAPVMSLDLPSDFTVQGGATNWNYGVTTFGDETNLAFRGSIDDDTAVVNVMVVSPLGTNGPYNAGVGGRTQVWGEVTLFEGSNQLVATAADAAGNVSTCLWTVIRDTSFMFRITSPLPWAVVNGTSVNVTCVADPEFSNAVVTVNDQSASIVAGSNLTFRTDAAFPLGDGVTKISACAVLNGQSHYADPNVTTYTITRWRSEEFHDSSDTYFWDFGENHEYEISRYAYEDAWDKDSQMHEHSSSNYWWWKAWDGTVMDDSSSSCTTNVATNCPSGWTKFGLEKNRSSRLFMTGCDNVAYDGEIRFIDDSMIKDKELVYLQFPGLDYGRSTNESVDPAKITFRGQPGFWYNSNVTFIAEIECDTEYVIAALDFDWPKYAYINAWYGGYWSTGMEDYSGHWLQIGSVTMDVFQAEILKPIGDARDIAGTNMTAHSFLDDTNSAGVPPFRYDWQGVTTSVSNWYRLDVQGDIDPDGFGYNWTLTAACGTFTNSTSPLPGHIPPSSISGNSVMGTLALEIMCGTTSIGYTNSKQVVIYRDHLQRDMENFVVGNLSTNDSQHGVMRGGDNELDFACHDSTTHAYKGKKGRTDFWTNNWDNPLTVTYDEPGYATPDFGSLARGDIIAYYHWSNVTHSQTCTGSGNETWGANNTPLMWDPSIGYTNAVWQFATATAGEHFKNASPSDGTFPVTIKLFKKP